MSGAAEQLTCALCHCKLEDMEDAADHLEQAHAVVTNALLENTNRQGGDQ